MPETRIAVLITSYNRREKTVACMNAVWQQESVKDIEICVYLVDDGSSDGTAEAILKKYPQTHVLSGNGHLYWCGGMRLAWFEAMKHDFDYYLWLNDDTILYTNALSSLIETFNLVPRPAIIVGSTKDPKTGRRSYGGLIRRDRFSPMDFIPIFPSEHPQMCDTMNGNCVLIPREIAHSLGNLSSEFTHGIGDIDYGLRAKKHGFSSWIAPGFHAVCTNNPGMNWTRAETSFLERWRILHSPKGLHPKEYLYFVKSHFSWYWIIAAFKLYLRVFFPGLWNFRARMKLNTKTCRSQKTNL